MVLRESNVCMYVYVLCINIILIIDISFLNVDVIMKI